jgi:hypothetical protein
MKKHASMVFSALEPPAPEVWTVAATLVKHRGNPPRFLSMRRAGPRNKPLGLPAGLVLAALGRRLNEVAA